ncbi:2-deoxy-scyllo-inosose synthase [Umezawaea tangerina]|uniref:3-dehydroquinate synthase n=1 Tax=Umezawaea tangerina TaxID=84725 RepID=A0A2T0SZS2_9PSEU|nr:2-deoxy-scyllo-inosose synthase [Umezawaea tangerina]PRY38918.1 3-dehydroquinate synthase [Umezawaea tangerina]
MKALDPDRVVVIADSALTEGQVGEVTRHVGKVAPTTVLTVHADEPAKSLEVVNSLAEQVFPTRITRQSVVIALGGGLVGNVAGLLSALIFRGIRLVHLPTTLLNMSDSVLSLKQAVNSSVGKNHLGAFHVPTLVWNHLDFLRTLPVDEIRSALCEMIKNVLCVVPERYDEVSARLRTDGVYPLCDIAWFIDLCVDAKSAVMRDDPREEAEGLVLEYGHTVGHAAELVTGGRLRHGYGVGLGLLAAARVSRELGFLDQADHDAHHELLRRNGAPTRLPADAPADAVFDAVRLDNKRGYVKPAEGMQDMILLDGLGRPHRTNGTLITQVPREVVRLGIDSIARIDDSGEVL